MEVQQLKWLIAYIYLVLSNLFQRNYETIMIQLVWHNFYKLYKFRLGG